MLICRNAERVHGRRKVGKPCSKLLTHSVTACECGAEVQTVDHVVLHCSIHRPPRGAYGLTVLLIGAQHLARDLVRPSSGLQELAETRRTYSC